MIARIWEGRTLAKHYETYTTFLREVAIPDYKQTPGFVRLSFLRRLEGDVAYYTLITYWENLDVIRHFAGSDYEKAKYYPEDENFLLGFPEQVYHFEVFADL